METRYYAGYNIGVCDLACCRRPAPPADDVVILPDMICPATTEADRLRSTIRALLDAEERRVHDRRARMMQDRPMEWPFFRNLRAALDA